MSMELVQLTQARDALEVARTLEDVKAILDIAVAAKRYAEARKLGEESVRYAQEVVNRATRRMGEMLAETPKHPAGRPPKIPNTSLGISETPKMADLGISYMQSSRAQKLAAIPDAVFEASASKPQNRLLRVGREAAAEARRAEPIEPVTVADSIEIRHGDFRDVLNDLDGTVDAIITDPPYPRQYWPLYAELGDVAARILKPNGVLAVMTGTRLEMVETVDEWISKHMRRRHRGVYLTPGQRWRDQIEHVATGWKPILIYAHPDATNLRWINNDVFSSSGTHQADQVHHHWGQSESGFADLIEGLTQPGDLVVDPFLGGGTTAIVCRDLRRRFIGCDVDPAAVSTSRERINGEP